MYKIIKYTAAGQKNEAAQLLSQALNFDGARSNAWVLAEKLEQDMPKPTDSPAMLTKLSSIIREIVLAAVKVSPLFEQAGK